ncbi:MAG: HlyD family efflux transporter periplasmic adaptor subunit, partial [Gammaproteobacteria bacterium]|nr:HlyD family efflux transporter periplasmic adaptor subunit [Gammaproteobacteria bacterium]
MQSIVQRWLAQLCHMLPGVQSAVVVLGDAPGRAQAIAQHCIASYPQGTSANAALLDAAALASRRGVPTTSTSNSAVSGNLAIAPDNDLLVSHPLPVAGLAAFHFENDIEAASCSIAVQLNVGAEHHAVVNQLLGWGAAWLQLLLDTAQPANTETVDTPGAATTALLAPDDLASLQKAFAEKSLLQAVPVVCNALKNALQCERVYIAIGSSQNDKSKTGLKIAGISNVTQFDRRVAALQKIESLMQEACNEGKALNAGRVLAQVVAGESDSAKKYPTVCLPLQSLGESLGALCVQSAQPLGNEAMQRLAAYAEILGAYVGLQQYREAWSWRATRLRFHRYLQRLLGEGFYRTKLATVFSVAALLLLFAVPGDHRVSATASLEGKIQRAVVAPFDGYIASALHKAGETIQMGEVLAELDQREIILERARWTSEKAELSKQYRKALAERDNAQSQILKAQIAQADAKLDLVAQQMDRAQLLSPLDGVIIDGDLSSSLGAPVERGDVLFEIAPLNEYRIVLDVSEREIREVQAGQRGWLSLTAFPGQRIPFVIDNVATVFEVRDGEVIYRTEARV